MISQPGIQTGPRCRQILSCGLSKDDSRAMAGDDGPQSGCHLSPHSGEECSHLCPGLIQQMSLSPGPGTSNVKCFADHERICYDSDLQRVFGNLLASACQLAGCSNAFMSVQPTCRLQHQVGGGCLCRGIIWGRSLLFRTHSQQS